MNITLFVALSKTRHGIPIQERILKRDARTILNWIGIDRCRSSSSSFLFFFRDKVAKNFPKFPFSHSLFSLSPAFFHSLLKMASFFSLVLFFFLLLLSFLYTTLFIVANCVNSDSDYYRDSISGRAGLRAFSPSVLVKRELHSRCSLPPLLSS